MGPADWVVILLYVVLVAGAVSFVAVIWWRIFSRAGYSGAMGLLMLIPLVNFAALIKLAFSEWPIHKELRRCREHTAKRIDD